MDFTFTSIQYVEEVGAIVDVHIGSEATLENGTPMGRIAQISVAVDSDENSTVADIQRRAQQQTIRFLQEAAEFVANSGKSGS